MGFNHCIAEKSVVLSGADVEYAASMAYAGKWVAGRKGVDKLCKDVNIGLEGVLDHKSVDLEKGRSGVPLLEEKEALFLSWAP